MFRTLGLAILPAVCLFAASFSVRADSCNPALLSWRDPGVAFPYSKQADGRCEGRYAKDDAGQGRILVASLVAARFDFDPKATASISLAWSAPKGKTIHLTACSLIRQVHYQMDVERPGDPGQYSWPMDVLSKTSLKSSDIGIVAFYQENIAGKAQPIYLPVSVNEFSPSTRAVSQLVFVPPIELSKASLSIDRITGSNAAVVSVQEPRPINRHYFPAEWPARIDGPIAGLKDGIYQLSIGAVISTDILVYINSARGHDSGGPTSSPKGKSR